VRQNLLIKGIQFSNMVKESRTRSKELFLSTRRNTLKIAAGTVIGSTLTTLPVTAQSADRELWSFKAGEFPRFRSAPTVVDGTVFVGGQDENLYAVDAETGTQKWAFETDDEIWISSPAVADGTVFIGSIDSSVYAVDAETGTEQWSFETGDRIDSSPTAVEGTVCIGSHDGNVYALDTETGDELWRFDSGAIVTSSPTIVDGTVFIGGQRQDVHALDLETGEEEWSFERRGNVVYSAPTVTDGTVFVGTHESTVHALDIESGEELWAYQTNGIIESVPTVADNTVFIGSWTEGSVHDEGWMYAIDATNGEEKWNFETGSAVNSSPTVVGDTVFVGSADGTIHALDVESGQEQWNYESESRIDHSLIVVNGILFASDSSRMFALEAGVDGSSEGSRALLGTTGHHHAKINSDPSQVDIDPNEDLGENNLEVDRSAIESASNERGSETDTDGDGGTAGVLFRSATEATDNVLTLVGGGFVSAGLGYLGYRIIQDDSQEASINPEISSASDQSTTAFSEKSKSSIQTIDRYDEVDLGRTVQQYSTVKISQATAQGGTVWILSPESDGETIDASQFDAFLDRVDPWTNMDAHPHLLSIYGSGSEPLPWLAIEPADYPSLLVLSDDFTIKKILQLLTQACDSIHHIQRYGLAYDHLSADSVLVDDGTAKLQGVLDQITGSASGYALPDAEEDLTTEQADVYRLGSLAYEVLTGSKPDQLELTPPSDHDTSLSAAVDEVLLKALAERPDDRHETVLHLRDDLQDCSDSI